MLVVMGSIHMKMLQVQIMFAWLTARDRRENTVEPWFVRPATTTLCYYPALTDSVLVRRLGFSIAHAASTVIWDIAPHPYFSSLCV